MQPVGSSDDGNDNRMLGFGLAADIVLIFYYLLLLLMMMVQMMMVMAVILFVMFYCNGGASELVLGAFTLMMCGVLDRDDTAAADDEETRGRGAEVGRGCEAR